jgi:hypothetical protein
MKELLGKVKNSKLVKRATGVFIAAQGYALTTFAAAPNQNGEQMILKTIDMATTWVRYIGAIAIIYGLIAFIMAWKGNNSESQSNSAMWIVVGAMLCSIKAIVRFIGIV